MSQTTSLPPRPPTSAEDACVRGSSLLVGTISERPRLGSTSKASEFRPRTTSPQVSMNSYGTAQRPRTGSTSSYVSIGSGGGHSRDSSPSLASRVRSPMDRAATPPSGPRASLPLSGAVRPPPPMNGRSVSASRSHAVYSEDVLTTKIPTPSPHRGGCGGLVSSSNAANRSMSARRARRWENDHLVDTGVPVDAFKGNLTLLHTSINKKQACVMERNSF